MITLKSLYARRSRALGAWVAVTFAACLALPATAQQNADAVYFSAVAEYFDLPASEVEILRDWRLQVEDIPVVLFVAGRTGVSPEALAQLRRGGRMWPDLIRQYGLDASHFHVPVADVARAFALRSVYEEFDRLEPSRWREVRLSDQDVIVLVNVRMAAETLRVPPDRILEAHQSTPSFVALYARLVPAGTR